MEAASPTVTDQAPPLVGYDVYATDRALSEAVARHLPAELAGEAGRELRELGRATGSAQVREWAEQANAFPPRLRTHDRYGHRIDEVDFHPSWYRLLGEAVASGLTDAWGRPGR